MATTKRITCDFCGAQLEKEGVQPIFTTLVFGDKWRPRVACTIETPPMVSQFDVCRTCFNTALHNAFK